MTNQESEQPVAPVTAMSDTSNAPSTAAGRALLDTHRNPGGDWNYVTAENLTARIREIEAEAIARSFGGRAQLQEADTQLLTLREAADRLLLRWQEGKHVEAGFDDLVRALNSTAEYNKQALARIREEAVKPCSDRALYGDLWERCGLPIGHTGPHVAQTQLSDKTRALASQSKSDTE